MGIFKKTIKYSKPSKDLDNKIKELDEELKNTGVLEGESDSEVFVVKESVVEKLPKIYDEVEVDVQVEEENLYHWRKSFAADSDVKIEELEEDEEQYHKSLNNVESYISQSNKELIEVRDQVFQEISESTLLNLPEIKDKISKVLKIYDQIQEGLLNEPPETKNSDPLTPLVSVEDLNKHYTLFINRIQQQLSTLGGGGETQLKYLDDIVGIATNASVYDGKFLKYDHSVGKFIFETVSGGVVGSAGTWSVDSVGINTIKNVGIGTTAKDGYKLYVEGDVRVTGIVTIGSSSITLDGNSNRIIVGTGVTINGSSGIISATAFHVNGSPIGATGAQGNQGVQGATGLVTGTNSNCNSFGVGTAASGTAGEIRATNNITAYYSDDRLKVRIGNIEDAVDKVRQLTGFYYTANELAKSFGYQGELQVGVSAQETQKVLPMAVVPAPIDDRFLTVRYEKIIPLLVEAIKELQLQIDLINKRLDN